MLANWMKTVGNDVWAKKIFPKVVFKIKHFPQTEFLMNATRR
jgi:hypothetical protein